MKPAKLKPNRNYEVGSEQAVRIANVNADRKVVNLYPGGQPIYWGGDRNLQNQGVAGFEAADVKQVEIEIQGEIWVRRPAGVSAQCGVMEEVFFDG